MIQIYNFGTSWHEWPHKTNIFQKKTTKLFKIAEKPHFGGYLVFILGPLGSFLVVNKKWIINNSCFKFVLIADCHGSHLQ